MAATASEILTEVRGLWKQGHDLAAALDAAQPPFTDPATTRTILEQWDNAQTIAYKIMRAADDLVALFNSSDEYGVTGLEQVDASDADEAAMRKSIKCLREQERALNASHVAFNRRFGGFPELLSAAHYAGPMSQAAQDEQAALFAGRPDVARLYRRIYGK